MILIRLNTTDTDRAVSKAPYTDTTDTNTRFIETSDPFTINTDALDANTSVLLV